MPKRSSDHHQSHATLLRRSPRFLRCTDPEKLEDHNTYKLKLRRSQVRSPYAVLALAAPSVQKPSIPKTPNPNPDRTSKKCSKLRKDLSKRFDEVGGLRRSPRLNNGVDVFAKRRQSSSFYSSRVEDSAIVNKVKNFAESGSGSTSALPKNLNPDPGTISKKCSKLRNDLVRQAAGVRRSPRLNNGVDEFTRHKQSSKFCSGVVGSAIVDKVKKCTESGFGSTTKTKREDKTAGSNGKKGAVAVKRVDKVKKCTEKDFDSTIKSKPEIITASSNRKKGAVAAKRVDKVKKCTEKDFDSTTKSKPEIITASSNRKKGAIAVERENEMVVEKERKRKWKRKRSCTGSLHGYPNGRVIANLGENRRQLPADRSQKGFIEKEANREKGEVCKISSEAFANITERVVCLGLKALPSEGEGKEKVCSGGEVEIKVKRTRKPCTESLGAVRGWTKEQEVALQRAYYASKPTPHFWKNVAKLVPGKSAQECFDKINSDHVTPPQVPAQSRAKKISPASIEQFSISATKLLEPNEAKCKRSKKRGHGAWKSIRKLLQKKCLVNGENGADLFSILEPNTDLSANALLKASPIIPTPVHQTADGFLIKCQEGYSGNKEQISKFSSSSLPPIFSPAVLKPVKNRVLHEKYIDHLHSRDAKRKAELERGKPCSGKENHKTAPLENVDAVKVAKNYLVANARDAINELKHLHTDSVVNSSDLDDDEAGDADGDVEL